MKKTYLLSALIMIVIASAFIYSLQKTEASSHREAPIIAADPQADNTDVYAFVPADNPNNVCIIANYIPFQDPAGGPNFYPFGTDVVYEINIDNNGDRVPDITYQFAFTTTVGNSNTFLYNTGQVNSLTDPNLNVKQTYTVARIVNGITQYTSSPLPVAPSYVGGPGHSDPNYAGPISMPNYQALMNAAIQPLPAAGGNVFCGQIDDPFFVDLGAAFDLLKIRPGAPGNSGGGKDALAGFNVNTISITVPKIMLTALPISTPPTDPNSIIGIWATASRRTQTVINADGSRTGTGPYIQVSRLGMPLVNELVIPLSNKNKWNASKPVDDAQFLNFVTSPELAGIINTLYPVTDDIPTTNRADLVKVFLTGVPGLTRRPQDTITPSEQLRLNVAIAPVAFASENRLGVIAGDNAGFPNGRRLKDDVVDISLRVVAGVLLGPPFSTGINASLGDGVNKNDKVFASTFPYVASPWDGYTNTHGQITGVSSNTSTIGNPNGFSLDQNYPNPFNPSTRITYNLNKADNVELVVYNMLGQIVRTLVNERVTAGVKTVDWNGLNDAGIQVPTGTYFAKLKTSNGVDTKKMMLVK
ncbi:DUF4331 domain-containing protein [soil metagenome]